MISYKYRKEYKQKLTELPNGEIKEEYVYEGKYFEIIEERNEHTKRKWFLLILNIVFTCAVFLNLYLYSNLAKTMYVVLPTALCAVSTYILFASIVIYWPVSEKLTREQKDKGPERLKAASFSQFVLCIAAVIGIIYFVNNYNGEYLPEDFLYTIFVIVMTLISALEFFISLKIQTKEVEKNLANEEKRG